MNAMYIWTADRQEALENFKVELCSTPILAFPVPRAMHMLDTDVMIRVPRCKSIDLVSDLGIN